MTGWSAGAVAGAIFLVLLLIGWLIFNDPDALDPATESSQKSKPDRPKTRPQLHWDTRGLIKEAFDQAEELMRTATDPAEFKRYSAVLKRLDAAFIEMEMVRNDRRPSVKEGR